VIVARAAFAVNWQLYRRAPRSVSGPSRGHLDAVGEPRFLTSVIRLPGEIAERLAGTASRLDALQPGHYLYPPASIHLTVLGLADVAGAAAEVEAAVGRNRPFAIEVGGLNLTRDTVFAELRPRGPGLTALRSDLQAVESPEHGSISRWIRRRLAHANLIRFTMPVDRRLVAEVGRLRKAGFGEFEAGEVELVHTDKVMSERGTRTLARFALH
jgi:2'-5' RNA ligase